MTGFLYTTDEANTKPNANQPGCIRLFVGARKRDQKTGFGCDDRVSEEDVDVDAKGSKRYTLNKPDIDASTSRAMELMQRCSCTQPAVITRGRHSKLTRPWLSA